MSASSAALSVVSLGVSCQVSHQIRFHLGGATIAGHAFRVDAAYFDYIITPIHSLLRALDGVFPDLPGPQAIEIALDQPLWTEQGLFLPHHFRHGGGGDEIDVHLTGPVDVAATYAQTAAKIAHLRRKFMLLDESESDLVFVLGNAQHNLESFCGHSSRVHGSFALNATLVSACRNLLQQRYGERFRRLAVVESGFLHSGPWQLNRVSRYNSGDLLGPPGAEWQGDHAFWAGLLHAEIKAATVDQDN